MREAVFNGPFPFDLSIFQLKLRRYRVKVLDKCPFLSNTIFISRGFHVKGIPV